MVRYCIAHTQDTRTEGLKGVSEKPGTIYSLHYLSWNAFDSVCKVFSKTIQAISGI